MRNTETLITQAYFAEIANEVHWDWHQDEREFLRELALALQANNDSKDDK